MSLSEFSNKFKNDLIKDLDLISDFCCPNCIINSINGWNEECCFYSKISESDKDSDEDCDKDNNTKLKLNCIYDFEEETNIEEIIEVWIESVLRLCKRKDKENYETDDKETRLFEKWNEIFKQVNG